MTFKISTASICAVIFLSACAHAQPADADGDLEHVRKALLGEQQAFDARDCSAVLDHFSDGPLLMIFNGNIQARAKSDIKRFCENNIAKLPPAPKPREVLSEEVRMLSPTTALSLTEYRFSGGPGTPPSIVTKIWTKDGDKWVMTYLNQSEIKKR